MIPTCPPPGKATTEAVGVARSLSMRKPSDPARQLAAIEAVRLRLRELFLHHCAQRAADADITATVLRMAPPEGPPPPLERLELHRVAGPPELFLASASDGYSSWVALYREEAGLVSTVLTVHDEGSALEQQLLLLDAAVVQPAGAATPLLALASSHPWASSCWRKLRFRIFSPGPDPHRPRTLLSHEVGGRVCEDVTIRAKGGAVRFEYLGWAGRLRGDAVERPAAFELRYANDRFVETYGFVGSAQHLVEDWLELPWARAREATDPAAAAGLEAEHAKLHGRKVASGSVYSAEAFPDAGGQRLTVSCARAGNQPCVEWPKPVDLRLASSGGHWLVRDVTERP